MKILIISQEFPPIVGGAGIVAAQNAKILAKKGHCVTVVTREGGGGKHKDSGYQVIKVRGRGVKKGKGKLWLLHMLLTLRNLDLESYDSIILNDIGAAFVFICLLKREALFDKTSYYLHGDEVKNIIENPKGYMKLFEFKKKLVEFIPVCKNVIAVSDYMKMYFLNSIGKNLPKEKFATVYAGVDSEVFFPIASDLFDKYKREGFTVILSASRIIKEKGYEKKLNVFRRARNEGHNLLWIVAGSGDYLNKLKKEAEKYCLSEYILFVGEIPRKDLKFYYSSADLFWLLSEREESFGLVYLEAQLCGCPAVGYANYGVAEAIQDGVTGYLIKKSEDFINLLDGEKKLDKEMVAKEAKKLSLDVQVEKLLSLLR
ncbi:glycosyltransferase family 4 protein [Halomonas sp. E14]|uniref:glycosyltransferase family 4 protein n=1 Tax=Halomonas sp. E14 TaxID=3397245 RepID=UPI00403ECCC4